MISLKLKLYELYALNVLIMLFTKNGSLVHACTNLDLTQIPGQCNKFYRCSNGIYLYSMRYFKNYLNIKVF